MSNFIKLTDMNNGRCVILNVSFIQSIEEQTNGSRIITGYNSRNCTYLVKQTPDEILNIIPIVKYLNE